MTAVDDMDRDDFAAVRSVMLAPGIPLETWIAAADPAQAAIFTDIRTERKRQDDKWGPQRHQDPHLWDSILMEEVGEVAEAKLNLRHAIKHTDGTSFDVALIKARYEELRKELVQVAAVAVANLEDFDDQIRRTGTVKFA